MSDEALERITAPWRERLEPLLADCLPAPDEQSGRLAEAMAYSLRGGGKRVRPMLVYAAGEALGRTPEPGLDAVAVAVECLHAYSLIHDDLPAMDDDDLRRGRPSCHIAFDQATAILAGDALQTLAFQTLAEAPEVNGSLRAALVSELAGAAGARGMVLGQAIDLQAMQHSPDLAGLERMHRHKTGALIRAAVVMAARVAGAEASERRSLSDYAEAVGLAFQVQDDILDVIGDTRTLGKQQGADGDRHKPTYVSLLGLEGARAKARELTEQSFACLEPFGAGAEPLRALARYIVERVH